MIDNELAKFVFYNSYSRWNEELGRRESWEETTERVVSYLRELSETKGGALPERTWTEIKEFIRKRDILPSMRLVAMAGKAARRNNASIYNCAYLPIEDLQAFPEILSLLMAGCGVGFSVERRYVDKLPEIAWQRVENPQYMLVEDSSEGWASALEVGISLWVNGKDILFDLSNIRPAGAPLKTKGGTASGPGPLKELLDHTRNIILSRQGKKLRSIDVYDIATMIGNSIVQGGVRRSAMICLFDLDDQLMLHSKDHQELYDDNWNPLKPWRSRANNSAVLERHSPDDVERILKIMANGLTGEPGIFSRAAARDLLPDRRVPGYAWGTNPCGEIILRPYQFCNLSMAVARAGDSLEVLRKKVSLATIVGTIQSMATDFPGLRREWKENCEAERLLGVDINGQMDNSLLNGSLGRVQKNRALVALRNQVISTNSWAADQLNINPSAASTCAKPSGNSSVFLNCSPGIHARHSPYYLRRVRVTAPGPIFEVLKFYGVSLEPDFDQKGRDEKDVTTWVATFPVKSPEGAVSIDQLSAIDQLNNWLDVKIHFTEHNPSCTITYRQEELERVIAWCRENVEFLGGLSFIPRSDIKYELMPYEEISQEEYSKFPRRTVRWEDLTFFEETDQTTTSQELACFAGACEI